MLKFILKFYVKVKVPGINFKFPLSKEYSKIRLGSKVYSIKTKLEERCAIQKQIPTLKVINCLSPAPVIVL